MEKKLFSVFEKRQKREYKDAYERLDDMVNSEIYVNGDNPKYVANILASRIARGAKIEISPKDQSIVLKDLDVNTYPLNFLANRNSAVLQLLEDAKVTSETNPYILNDYLTPSSSPNFSANYIHYDVMANFLTAAKSLDRPSLRVNFNKELTKLKDSMPLLWLRRGPFTEVISNLCDSMDLLNEVHAISHPNFEKEKQDLYASKDLANSAIMLMLTNGGKITNLVTAADARREFDNVFFVWSPETKMSDVYKNMVHVMSSSKVANNFVNQQTLALYNQDFFDKRPVVEVEFNYNKYEIDDFNLLSESREMEFNTAIIEDGLSSYTDEFDDFFVTEYETDKYLFAKMLKSDASSDAQKMGKLVSVEEKSRFGKQINIIKDASDDVELFDREISPVTDLVVNINESFREFSQEFSSGRFDGNNGRDNI